MEAWHHLQPDLEKAFKKVVSTGELTLYQTDLAKGSALVLTTRAVYLLEKKWWKARAIPVAWAELAEAVMEGRDKIRLRTARGASYLLPVDQEHFAQAVKAVNRILELLNKR